VKSCGRPSSVVGRFPSAAPRKARDRLRRWRGGGGPSFASPRAPAHGRRAPPRDDGREFAPARTALRAEVLEARRGHLSFAGGLPTPTELERIIGTNDLVDEFYLSRGLVAAKPVCRLVLRDGGDRARGYATGFMVSPRLLLTNCHVFPNLNEATNALAQFDYTLDIRGADVTPVQFR
jgi:hypothetical protein